jgi:hypothetical protein
LPQAAIVGEGSRRDNLNVNQRSEPQVPQEKTVATSEALTKEEIAQVVPEPHAAVRVNSTEFEIEINQTVIVRKIDSLVQTWCANCGAEGQWVTAENAAIIANSDTRSIYRRIEAGAVHFLEQADLPQLVCLSSLFE